VLGLRRMEIVIYAFIGERTRRHRDDPRQSVLELRIDSGAIVLLRRGSPLGAAFRRDVGCVTMQHKTVGVPRSAEVLIGNRRPVGRPCRRS
jgi:putative heme iron utilization protein